MNKIKVLCLSIWYPLSMSRYFEKALKNNPNVELKTTGPFTGSFIPWMNGMILPEKYAIPPDLPLPFPPNVGRISYEFVQAQLGDWKPDLIISVDAGLNWSSKPSAYLATIATDPHALNYDHQRKISDKFFNMQLCYSEPKDVYLPYAYSQYDHYPEVTTSEKYFDNGKSGTMMSLPVKDTDAVLIGMPYEQRIQWVNELRKHGVSVIFENSPIFDEYRALANRARIGLNWSSLNDLNARAFETAAFGLCPVMNRVPDIGMFFEDGTHYLGFSNLSEAVEKVLWAKNNPEDACQIAQNAYSAVQGNTYDSRIAKVLKECGF